ncbi:hypothetical protein K437DRAFT_266126 [Tilletiaria anomala UBC 951]|uniref:Pyridoxamine 5'-phosphate oxidase Alr4036 family FMN-binding domain-containing protein n=1 Tax=Tilletiaria anomala (strain ATCC 24038 / CBS 436.72 / UBC 951) TaxID=1037660 RepID=A0A066WQL6_TILAU|nr:uncharacterized protein K437DRAFT_266126 [Tilletiaria anomala UBC 951]KDN52920.1 hypothetical protein K437DRAFT_266126 [Tilletiaria anomala UBC 951]
MATNTSPVPQWKELITQTTVAHRTKEEGSVLYYVLSTVNLGPSIRPQARYVVHRGFVNEQRSKTTESGVEPAQADYGMNTCLLTTTDIRSPKAQQILKQQQQEGEAHVEIAWWMEKAQLQFRLACTAHLLPHADNEHYMGFDGSKLVPPPASLSSKRPTSFDWAFERSRIFEKMSLGLLASFARPTPGSEHPNGNEIDAEGAGKDHEDGLNDKANPWPMELPKPGDAETKADQDALALSDKNFALVVLAPYKVDVLDLVRSKRSVFELQGGRSGGNEHWTAKRVVP